ncbi:universal stress protein [Desulforhopalus singaporensis]|uniref:Nucleotide-binding universal stress protein, UspA family n=1 Tax=Desulforhopalus singaporensis TaxID=91360 RepID=A0A1H0L3Z0_9BACT|nr:universal stress protein [Desulforhopalus singaporensis]SDO62947.1 Nucleotide-binding universal stress protein, UspA family [Desulforhopalus singaporensis]
MEDKKILVAIDGSPHSDRVVAAGIEYAKLLKAKVVLVYCHRRIPAIVGEPSRSDSTAYIIERAEKLITSYTSRFREAAIPVEERLMEEPASPAITEVARIQHCELIIMGSRGLTNLEGLFVGSVTNRVLHTTPCSVLVVK